MGQLGVNLGPTWANMAALGQLGAIMCLAKPEKLMFRILLYEIITSHMLLLDMDQCCDEYES